MTGPSPAADALSRDAHEETARAAFGRPVTRTVLLLVGAMAVLAGVIVFQLVTRARAVCDGELMGRGDTCVCYRGTSSGYDQTLRAAQHFKLAMEVGSAAGMAAALVLIVVVVAVRPPRSPELAGGHGVAWFGAPAAAFGLSLRAAAVLIAAAGVLATSTVLDGIGGPLLVAAVPAGSPHSSCGWAGRAAPS